MADLQKEEQVAADRKAGDPCDEAKMPNGKPGPQTQEGPKTKGLNGAKKEETPLPKLSAADFKIYNGMAEHMNYFHNHFRKTWDTLYTACLNNRRPPSLSLAQFLTLGLHFVSQLTAHHSIEEKHIFPMLARRMPEFKAGKNAAELLRQHKEIHKGMDEMEAYLKACKTGMEDFELSVLKRKMEGWAGVLWKHLDEEVATLGAENMRKYWTVEEMKRMPM